MKPFNGKAIYNPSGKAAEYAKWACNFYVGCSNGCEYCYCKKGILAGVMGQNKPQLKKCFRDEKHAVELTEPNHLDYKVKNKYDEWVWKSPYSMNRYADDWEAWHNQEREKFKEKHGLSDEELNYRGENEIVRVSSHCV